MRKLVAFIPNFLTLCNITCGVLSIYTAIYHRLDYAFYLIILCAIFDFLDGFAARILNARSEIGLQLDSLCDVVSFGAAPAIIATISLEPFFMGYSYIMLLLVPFAAYRLAVFNVDTEQSDEFKGLPTPAMALLVSSLVSSQVNISASLAPYAVVLMLLLCVLMVSRIPMFSFKFKNFSIAKNLLRYAFAIYSVIVLVFMDFNYAVAIIILTYIVVSLVVWMVNMVKQRRH